MNSLSLKINTIGFCSKLDYCQEKWALRIAVNGQDTQLVSFKRNQEVKYQFLNITSNPILCIEAVGPTKHSTRDVYGSSNKSNQKSWRLIGFKQTELNIAKLTKEPFKVQLHDPSYDGDKTRATVTVEFDIQTNLPKSLTSTPIPKGQYKNSNASYIDHWSTATPIGDSHAERRNIARIHSPFFDVDGTVLPITYWVRRIAKLDNVDNNALFKAHILPTRNYYQNALNLVLKTSPIENAATFNTQVANFLKDPNIVDTDLLEVISDTVLFPCRNVDYVEDLTIEDGRPTELYKDADMAFGRNSADCEDYAKLCQKSFYAIQDSFHAQFNQYQTPSEEMNNYLKVLQLYTVAICQGAVNTGHGHLTNHMWATLIPKTDILQFSGKNTTSITPTGIPKLILEGTAEHSQANHESSLAFYKQGTHRFYKYILDLHLHPSEQALFPDTHGTCTDYILVNRNKDTYGMDILDFMKPQHEWNGQVVEPALVTTAHQDSIAKKDYFFLPPETAPKLAQLSHIPTNKVSKWKRVYLADADDPSVVRVDKWWGVQLS